VSPYTLEELLKTTNKLGRGERNGKEKLKSTTGENHVIE